MFCIISSSSTSKVIHSVEPSILVGTLPAVLNFLNFFNTLPSTVAQLNSEEFTSCNKVMLPLWTFANFLSLTARFVDIPTLK